MGIFYYYWKVWLWLNNSEKEPATERHAELPTQSVVKSNKDIAERLTKEGVEINYSTLTYIIDQYDRIVRDFVCEGYAVKTNNVLLTPDLSGEWPIDTWEFDATKHKCTVQCTPTLEMQRAMRFIGVKVLGFKNAPPKPSQDMDKEVHTQS